MYSSGSGSDCMAWESLRLGGMCSSTFALLEFHFLSRNPPWEKREWSWVCNLIASAMESAPVRQSFT